MFINIINLFETPLVRLQHPNELSIKFEYHSLNYKLTRLVREFIFIAVIIEIYQVS